MNLLAELAGRFAQESGTAYDADPTAAVGSRLSDVTVDGPLLAQLVVDERSAESPVAPVTGGRIEML